MDPSRMGFHTLNALSAYRIFECCNSVNMRAACFGHGFHPFIRAELDDRSEKIGKKIRDTEVAKVPYMLVVGEKEMNEGKVAIRRQGKGDLGVKSIEDFIADIRTEFTQRIGQSQ